MKYPFLEFFILGIILLLMFFQSRLFITGIEQAQNMGVKNAENTLILQRDLINLQEILLKK